MPRANRRRSPDHEWTEFSRRHPGHPFLSSKSLYALSEPIIDAIKAEMPEFFTADQEAFERDLCNTASLGFFNRLAMVMSAQYRQLDRPAHSSVQERIENPIPRILDSVAEHLLGQGWAPSDVIEHFQQRFTTQEAIEARQQAYVGWLICNRQFRDEVTKLRGAWDATVEQHGKFPAYPRWPYLGGRHEDDDFHQACYHFYQRWGLDRMLTWDLPLPMEPDLAVGLLEDLRGLSDAGAILILPWYLLRGEKLDLQSIIRQARSRCGARHLDGWLQRKANDEMGDIGFANLAWIYRYHELVLIRRYSAACRGQIQGLDRALARVIGRDEDTVKKLRLKFKRSLRSS